LGVTEKLLWTVAVQAVGGPQLAAADGLEVDGYDKFAIEVPANGSIDVDLGPGGDAATCLVVLPPAGVSGLTYEIDGDAISLDAPLFLLGGAVALTGSPATLTFSNADAADVSIEILLGRKAS
jgi:hypothetical protein